MSAAVSPSANSSMRIYEYYSIEFKATHSLYQTAAADSDDFRFLIAKIIAYTVVPFLLVAAFEAVVVNGTRLVLNGVIWIVNSSNSLFFGSGELPEAPEIPPLPPLPIAAVMPMAAAAAAPLPSGFVDEPLPPLLVEEEKRFLDMLQTLAEVGILFLALHKPRMDEHAKMLAHIHPLQSLGYMLDKSADRKKYMKEIFKRNVIPGKFVSETLEALESSLHAPKTERYMEAFAEKVGIEANTARRFLRQNPPSLYDLIIYILRRS